MGLIMRRTDDQKISSSDEVLALRAAPQRSPVPVRRASPLREGPRIRKRGLYMGTAPDGQAVYLSPKHLRTHIDLIGPTGQGKSRLLLFLFELLCHTNRPIVLIDPKGG